MLLAVWPQAALAKTMDSAALAGLFAPFVTDLGADGKLNLAAADCVTMIGDTLRDRKDKSTGLSFQYTEGKVEEIASFAIGHVKQGAAVPLLLQDTIIVRSREEFVALRAAFTQMQQDSRFTGLKRCAFETKHTDPAGKAAAFAVENPQTGNRIGLFLGNAEFDWAGVSKFSAESPDPEIVGTFMVFNDVRTACTSVD